MEQSKMKTMSRRAMLRRSTGMLGSIALIPIVLQASAAHAGGGNKAMLHYQDTPKDGQTCGQCTAFTPGSEAGTGNCKVVGGPVSAQGWCMAFSHR